MKKEMDSSSIQFLKESLESYIVSDDDAQKFSALMNIVGLLKGTNIISHNEEIRTNTENSNVFIFEMGTTNELSSNLISLTLHDIIELLEPYLTSTEEAARTEATMLIACLLNDSTLLLPLTSSTVHLLIIFFTKRLHDLPSLIPCLHALNGIISSYDHSMDPKYFDIVDIFQAIFHGIYVPSYNQSVRQSVLNLIQTILHSNIFQRSHQFLSKDLIHGMLTILEGEKDPRCLQLNFDLLLQALEAINVQSIANQDEIEQLSKDVFDGVISYFPITFKPPDDDPYGITSDGLIHRFHQILIYHSNWISILPHTMMFMMQQCSNDSPSHRKQAWQCFLDVLTTHSIEILQRYPLLLRSQLSEQLYHLLLQEPSEEVLQQGRLFLHTASQRIGQCPALPLSPSTSDPPSSSASDPLSTSAPTKRCTFIEGWSLLHADLLHRSMIDLQSSSSSSSSSQEDGGELSSSIQVVAIVDNLLTVIMRSHYLCCLPIVQTVLPFLMKKLSITLHRFKAHLSSDQLVPSETVRSETVVSSYSIEVLKTILSNFRIASGTTHTSTDPSSDPASISTDPANRSIGKVNYSSIQQSSNPFLSEFNHLYVLLHSVITYPMMSTDHRMKDRVMSTDDRMKDRVLSIESESIIRLAIESLRELLGSVSYQVVGLLDQDQFHSMMKFVLLLSIFGVNLYTIEEDDSWDLSLPLLSLLSLLTLRSGVHREDPVAQSALAFFKELSRICITFHYHKFLQDSLLAPLITFIYPHHPHHLPSPGDDSSSSSSHQRIQSVLTTIIKSSEELSLLPCLLQSIVTQFQMNQDPIDLQLQLTGLRTLVHLTDTEDETAPQRIQCLLRSHSPSPSSSESFLSHIIPPIIRLLSTAYSFDAPSVDIIEGFEGSSLNQMHALLLTFLRHLLLLLPSPSNSLDQSQIVIPILECLLSQVSVPLTVPQSFLSLSILHQLFLYSHPTCSFYADTETSSSPSRIETLLGQIILPLLHSVGEVDVPCRYLAIHCVRILVNKLPRGRLQHRLIQSILVSWVHRLSPMMSEKQEMAVEGQRDDEEEEVMAEVFMALYGSIIIRPVLRIERLFMNPDHAEVPPCFKEEELWMDQLSVGLSQRLDISIVDLTQSSYQDVLQSIYSALLIRSSFGRRKSLAHRIAQYTFYWTQSESIANPVEEGMVRFISDISCRLRWIPWGYLNSLWKHRLWQSVHRDLLPFAIAPPHSPRKLKIEGDPDNDPEEKDGSIRSNLVLVLMSYAAILPVPLWISSYRDILQIVIHSLPSNSSSSEVTPHAVAEVLSRLVKEGGSSSVRSDLSDLSPYLNLLIPELLQCAQSNPLAKYRVMSLDSLAALCEGLSYAKLFPYKKTVSKRLTEVLDDRKRAVRQHAARTRNKWMMLNKK